MSSECTEEGGDKGITKCLTDADIEDLTASVGGCRIMRYLEMSQQENIDELFSKNNCIALLYLTKSENFGHWTALIRDEAKHTIYFFDSYGKYPDYTLIKVVEELKEQLNMTRNYLAKLLLGAMEQEGWTIDYSDHRLQKTGKGVNTCGRWVAARILRKELSNDEFANLFHTDNPKERMDPDFLVTAWTDHLLKGIKGDQLKASGGGMSKPTKKNIPSFFL
jgi:hypothetical protein